MERFLTSHTQSEKATTPFFGGIHPHKEKFFPPKLAPVRPDNVYQRKADADKTVQRKWDDGNLQKQIMPIRTCPVCQTKPDHIQRAVKVDAGVELNTMGFHVPKTGDTYIGTRVTRDSVWNELISSLFYSPRIFHIKGSTNFEANKNFKAHLKARWDIIQFAAKKQYKFAAGTAVRMDPTLWDVDHAGDSINVKPGVNQYKAMEEMNKNKDDQYAIGCQAATKFTMMGGSKSELYGDYNNPDYEWIPGDWGSIENTNFPATGGIPGREGENIIYVGEDLYWGHISNDVTYKSLDAWIELVNSWNNGGAVIEDWRNYPRKGLM